MGRRTRQSVFLCKLEVKESSTATYRSVVGLGDQAVIILAIHLNNFGALWIETSIGRESCEESRSCNSDGCSVDHFVEARVSVVVLCYTESYGLLFEL